jgi:hypothetical protein
MATAVSDAKAAGIVHWNPARVEGIYSIQAMKTYCRQCIYFSDWVKQKYPSTKLLHDAKQFAGEYLQFRMQKVTLFGLFRWLDLRSENYIKSPARPMRLSFPSNEKMR